MRVITGASVLKTGLSHMIVIICMSLYYHRQWFKNVNSFFMFVETINVRYIIYRIANCVSLY